jgi:hypothetical protein
MTARPPSPCDDAFVAQRNQQPLRTLDRGRLAAALTLGGDSLYEAISASRPHLFADTALFVAPACLQAMAELIAAIEAVVALPAYRLRVLAQAPAIARHPQAACGVFFGYDFHLTAAGPRLIEINTNAGGGLLNACLARAQSLLVVGGDAFADFVAMFRAEWLAAHGAGEPWLIAIVDDAPDEQYLQPEFELFRRLFAAAGLTAVIADPAQLQWDGNCLRHGGQPVAMVYNRLTDFELAEPAHAALRAAYLADAVVVTPHPQAHALYADKRNLVFLSDDAWLAEIGVAASIRALLAAAVPRTRQVHAADGELWWSERRRWFFKPAAGFGSRAAYRGDKLTRRVFEEILQGDYIAQEIVPPSVRTVEVDGALQALKVDLRNYVYRGQVQLVAARLYQGQTTNFRTPGGGFAPVIAAA